MDTVLRVANETDWLYIDGLRKKEGSALGFLPKDAYLSVLERRRIADRNRFEYQDIVLTEDNNSVTGFCYVSYHGNFCKVIQIAIQEDARMWYRATLILSEIERRSESRGNVGVMCRVAFDLESNFFWVASGYVPIGKTISTWLNQSESKSKRPLIVYQKLFNPLFS